MIRSPGMYIPCSSFSVSEMAGKIFWILLSPFYIWIAFCSHCSLQILDPQHSRKECSYPPVSILCAGCLQMSAICLSHAYSEWGAAATVPWIWQPCCCQQKFASSENVESSKPQNWSQKVFTLDKIFDAEKHKEWFGILSLVGTIGDKGLSCLPPSCCILSFAWYQYSQRQLSCPGNCPLTQPTPQCKMVAKPLPKHGANPVCSKQAAELPEHTICTSSENCVSCVLHLPSGTEEGVLKTILLFPKIFTLLFLLVINLFALYPISRSRHQANKFDSKL